jgi:hypothetical protein
MKHLHKFYNKADTPWVQLIWNTYYENVVPHVARPCGSFWWRDIMQLAGDFRSFSSVTPRSGDSFSFWTDKWTFMGTNQPLSDRFPRLLSFVLDKDMSTTEVFIVEEFSHLFYRPLSAEAHREMCLVQQGMADQPLSMTHDGWKYNWGDAYLPSKQYAMVHAHMVVSPVFK